MDLDESKQKGLSLIAEYSTDGVPIPAGENADYLNRMNRFADIAQKQVAQIKKIHAVYSISQNPIPNPLNNGSDIAQHLKSDLTYQAIGSRSYYFEVDNAATIYIDEQINGTWQVINSITNTAKGKYTAYKGLISPINPGNAIRLRFSGQYPYNVRNVALYEVTFASVDDIQPFTKYLRYAMPSDFMRVKQVDIDADYQWQGKTLLVERDYSGSFDVEYYRYPTTITADTPDTYEFEVDVDAQEAIPFFMGARAVADENEDIASALMGEYRNMLANLKTIEPVNVEKIRNVYGRF